jgi:hypothetical protein
MERACPLGEEVEEAWNAIPNEKVKDLVRSIRACCRAVIEAEGWHTKY